MVRDMIGIMVCVDCGLYIANGEVDDSDPTWKPENIEQRWAGYYIVNGDSEKDDEFSWQPCEACGSHLGGARMHCVAIAD